MAARHLHDLEYFLILHQGGCDVNAVNNDTKTPLGLLRDKLDKSPGNDKLMMIDGFLESIGAVVNWRDAKWNHINL